jgi:integrase
MPREAKGTTFQQGERWYAQVTLDAGERPKFPLPTCASKEAADARKDLLADLARKLRGAKVTAKSARELLTDAGAAAEGKALDRVLRTIDAFCDDSKTEPSDGPAKPVTFRAVGERWTSGELARLYPDHVRVTKGADEDRQALERHVYPFVEDVAIGAFTVDHADRIMRALPHKEPATRRGYALLVNRICALAAYPLRLIPANPLPRGWTPSRGKPKARAYLYPDEDRKLLGCVKVPVCWRTFYGFLDREGCRAYTEAARFDLRDVDLERGVVTLDQNKTDDPRAWVLDPGVVRALRASIALREAEGGAPLPPSAPLFVDEDGRRISEGDHHADHFRAYLMAAGVDRPELFERSASRVRIRVHDLRATFITTNLANGRSETWISDRTGHKSSKEIHGYNRQARTAAQLGLGDLTPLDTAIPELGGRGRNGGPESPSGAPGSAHGGPNDAGSPASGQPNPGGTVGSAGISYDAPPRRRDAGAPW